MSIFSIWGYYSYFIVRLFTAAPKFKDAFSSKQQRISHLGREIWSSSSSAFDWLHQVFSPVDVTSWTVLRRSAAVPHSLASSVVSICQICFRVWLCNVQSCRTWARVWSAIRQSHIEIPQCRSSSGVPSIQSAPFVNERLYFVLVG